MGGSVLLSWSLRAGIKGVRLLARCSGKLLLLTRIVISGLIMPPSSIISVSRIKGIVSGKAKTASFAPRMPCWVPISIVRRFSVSTRNHSKVQDPKSIAIFTWKNKGSCTYKNKSQHSQFYCSMAKNIQSHQSLLKQWFAFAQWWTQSQRSNQHNVKNWQTLLSSVKDK